MSLSLVRSLWLSALALVMAASMAWAQPEASPNDLRRENDELRQRVAQLQAQVAEKNRRIKELEDELKKLKDSGATPPPPATTPGPAPGATPPAAPAPTTGAPVPSDPMAAPEGLFKALVQDYQDSVGSLPRENDADRRRYQREVGSWVRNIERRFRGDVNWLISVVSLSDERGQTTIDFRTLDPATGQPFSADFTTITIPTRTVQAMLDKPDQKTWKLAGKLTAKPNYNAQRDAGAGKPALIGPYAEFGFDLIVQSVAPAMAPTPRP